MNKDLQKALANVQALIDEKNENINALTAFISELTDELIKTKKELEKSEKELKFTRNIMFSKDDSYERAIRSLKGVFTDEFCKKNDIYYVDFDGEIFYPSDI